MSEYIPSEGFVNSAQVNKAVSEFNRIRDSELDPRVLVAKGIRIKQFMDGSLGDKFRHVRFEVRFQDPELNTDTRGDLYILRYCKSTANYLINPLLIYSLSQYSKRYSEPFIVGGGGYVIPGGIVETELNTFSLDKPQFIREEIIGVIETYDHNRSVTSQQAAALELFENFPNLRYAVSIRVFQRSPDAPHNYAALALLVRRGGDGGPYFDDVVGFGTAHLPSSVVADLRDDARAALRQLPEQTTGAAFRARNPWLPAEIPAHRPFVSVPAADMFVRRGAAGERPAMLAGVPEDADPWELDLWNLGSSFDAKLTL